MCCPSLSAHALATCLVGGGRSSQQSKSLCKMFFFRFYLSHQFFQHPHVLPISSSIMHSSRLIHKHSCVELGEIANNLEEYPCFCTFLYLLGKAQIQVWQIGKTRHAEYKPQLVKQILVLGVNIFIIDPCPFFRFKIITNLLCIFFHVKLLTFDLRLCVIILNNQS